MKVAVEIPANVEADLGDVTNAPPEVDRLSALTAEPIAFDAVTVKEANPAAIGVPLILPVVAFRVAQEGSAPPVTAR